ncbi:MAG: ATPase [Gemmatimonadetes bacterium]|nr:ATPase [Gemmatimonadota bacterium]
MTAIEPVRKEVTIAASADHAFRVFTEGVDRWWPRQHHIGKSPMARAVIEPRLGGRWYAISEDGSECDTGKVLAWDPPRRLILAWQITADWQYDPNFLTEVEVTFTAVGPKETVVVLEHRDLERFGERAMELRNGIDAEGGWGLILQSYIDEAEGRPSAVQHTA